jgi:hypothetical protein
MPTKAKPDKKLRPHDIRKPPLNRPTPPGASDEPAALQGVELQAQRLVHKAGSAEEAKKVIDAAVARETKSDFRQDSFAARWGFSSRAELLAASCPLFNDEQSNWWATELPGGEWIVWGDEDLSARKKFASLAEARRAVGDQESH